MSILMHSFVCLLECVKVAFSCSISAKKNMYSYLNNTLKRRSYFCVCSIFCVPLLLWSNAKIPAFKCMKILPDVFKVFKYCLIYSLVWQFDLKKCQNNSEIKYDFSSINYTNLIHLLLTYFYNKCITNKQTNAQIFFLLNCFDFIIIGFAQ